MRKFLLTLYFIFIILLATGCTSYLFKILPGKNYKNSQKINNILDVNEDGKSDLLFWHLDDGNCFFQTIGIGGENHQSIKLGSIGDIPIFGDFTGDGTTDYGIYKNTDGINRWHLIDGLTMTSFEERYGEVGDLPIPSDFDGDGKFDFVVYRPKNSGFYGTLSHKNTLLEIHFGVTGDVPVVKDYDGDGIADIATYRLASGAWSIKSSRSNSVKQVTLGGKDYIPVPADYDGDGKADPAVWNYKNNDCKIIFSFLNLKLSKDKSLKIQDKLKDVKCFPIPLDFDGDGKSELAFWEKKKKTVHMFNIGANDFKYEKFHLNLKKGAEVINYFFLKRFTNRNYESTLKHLYKKYKSVLSAPPNEFLCDLDGDFINEKGIYDPASMSLTVNMFSSSKDSRKYNLPGNFIGKSLAGDFDGDGKCDYGILDSETKIFNYLSSASNKSVSIPLNDRFIGVPFSDDLDLDFMSDLVFYNPLGKIFGFVLSSESYRYDEAQLYSKKF